MHQLNETRHPGTGRKLYRCATCKQEWTRHPRVSCPGVPVMPWSKDHGYLRTMTQAKKERIVIPPDAKPVAALRGEKEYFWLYDIREYQAKPLTMAQVLANQQREATIRKKYGCRMCEYRYLAREHKCFIDGVCQKCRDKARGWSDLVKSARLLVAQHIPILVLQTKPEERLVRSGSRQKHQIVGYQMYSMDTDKLVAEQSLAQLNDYATLFGILEMSRMAGAGDATTFLFPTEYDLGLFWEEMVKHFGIELRNSYKWGWDRLTTYLPLYRHIPLFPHEAEKGWHAFPDPMYQSYERYFANLCAAFGLQVDSAETVSAMVRRVVLHLAQQSPIEMAE